MDVAAVLFENGKCMLEAPVNTVLSVSLYLLFPPPAVREEKLILWTLALAARHARKTSLANFLFSSTATSRAWSTTCRNPSLAASLEPGFCVCELDDGRCGKGIAVEEDKEDDWR